MEREEKANSETWKKSKLEVRLKTLTQIIIEKCMNILILQVSFINILKNSALKTIKTGVHCNNHRKKYRNAKCIKLPNYRYKENENKNMQN